MAGCLPTVLLLLAIVALHLWALAKYHSGPKDGFMSPVIVVVMTWPIILMNLMANFITASKIVSAE